MLAVIVGLVFAVAGVWGVIRWLPDMLIVCKGLIPFMIFVGGCISVVAGITAIRDSMEDAKGKEKEREKANSEQNR